MKAFALIVVVQFFLPASVAADDVKNYCSDEYIARAIQLFIDGQKVEALSALLKSEGCGSLDVEYTIGVIYSDKYLDIYSPDESFRYIQKASELGHAESTRTLAWHYRLGVGVAADDGMFCNKLIKAAIMGSAFAADQLYSVVISRTCGSVSMKDVIQYLIQSVPEGYPPALAKLGLFFVEGKNVRQDIDRGLIYLKNSAHSGYLPAQIYLYTIYARGDYVEKDCKKAQLWHSMVINNASSVAPDLMSEFQCE